MTAPIDSELDTNDSRVLIEPVISDSALGLITDIRPDCTIAGAWLAGSNGVGYLKYGVGLEQLQRLDWPHGRMVTRGNHKWIRWDSETTWKLISLEELGLEEVTLFNPNASYAVEWQWSLPQERKGVNAIALVQPLRTAEGRLLVAVWREYGGDVFLLDEHGHQMQKTNWGLLNEANWGGLNDTYRRFGELGSTHQLLICAIGNSLVVRNAAGELVWRAQEPERVQGTRITPLGVARSVRDQYQVIAMGVQHFNDGSWTEKCSLATISMQAGQIEAEVHSLANMEAASLRRERGSLIVRLKGLQGQYAVELVAGSHPEPAAGRSITMNVRTLDGQLVKRGILTDGALAGNHLSQPTILIVPHDGRGDQEDLLVAWGTVLYRLSASTATSEPFKN